MHKKVLKLKEFKYFGKGKEKRDLNDFTIIYLK
jgi:hypothetical protein